MYKYTIRNKCNYVKINIKPNVDLETNPISIYRIQKINCLLYLKGFIIVCVLVFNLLHCVTMYIYYLLVLNHIEEFRK